MSNWLMIYCLTGGRVGRTQIEVFPIWLFSGDRALNG